MNASKGRPSLLPLLTCEHAVNSIPEEYAAAFAGAAAERALSGHRGYDIGAIKLASGLRSPLGSELYSGSVSRLLVDLNRSRRHRSLFSEFSRALPATERERILARYYHPYIERVRAAIAGLHDRGASVLHLSIHSFTPTMAGQRRRADIGLLYDPARAPEQDFCTRLQRRLQARSVELGFRSIIPDAAAGLIVRRNYPYRGTADGLTTQLRRSFAPERYLGIEIEVNQQHFDDAEAGGQIARLFADSLRRVLNEPESV